VWERTLSQMQTKDNDIQHTADEFQDLKAATYQTQVSDVCRCVSLPRDVAIGYGVLVMLLVGMVCW
jgi:hypothetical protein